MWLYLTAHRQGDLRRMAHVYHRDPLTLWPVGVYVNPGSPPLIQPTTTNGIVSYVNRFVMPTTGRLAFTDETQLNALYNRMRGFESLTEIADNVLPDADAATVSPRFVERIVALNLLSPFYMAQPANAVMQDQDDGGSIVNIGSVSAHHAAPLSAAYSAAKAGLVQLTRSLALEWAPKVRVNHITTGLILTDSANQHYGQDGGPRRRQDDPDGPDGGAGRCRVGLPVPGLPARGLHHRCGPGRARRRRDPGPVHGRSGPPAGTLADRPATARPPGRSPSAAR